MDDRIEAMRILSAGNTIMMLVLGAILGLQVSPDYRPRGRSAWFLDGATSPDVPPSFSGAAHVFSRRLVADAVSRTIGLSGGFSMFSSFPPLRLTCDYIFTVG